MMHATLWCFHMIGVVGSALGGWGPRQGSPSGAFRTQGMSRMCPAGDGSHWRVLDKRLLHQGLLFWKICWAGGCAEAGGREVESP